MEFLFFFYCAKFTWNARYATVTVVETLTHSGKKEEGTSSTSLTTHIRHSYQANRHIFQTFFVLFFKRSVSESLSRVIKGYTGHTLCDLCRIINWFLVIIFGWRYSRDISIRFRSGHWAGYSIISLFSALMNSFTHFALWLGVIVLDENCWLIGPWTEGRNCMVQKELLISFCIHSFMY